METEVNALDERQFTVNEVVKELKDEESYVREMYDYAIASKAAMSTFEGKQLLDKLTKLHREYLDKILERKRARSEVKKSAESMSEIGKRAQSPASKSLGLYSSQSSSSPTKWSKHCRHGYYLHESISLRNLHVIFIVDFAYCVLCFVSQQLL
ncbi:unnamed protein product [Haemonchus placei]|uniref:ING domain-containing protein n=1 Tax=Haemonchus placei TaxID=6290 RepID=A0A0N4WRY2_HAEPC|nr:unnamed protein product [Haemonchus placei]